MRVTHLRRTVAVLATLLVALWFASACGAGRTDKSSSSSASKPIVVGTTDKVVALDPAGSYDNGSLQVETQVYSYLLNFPEGAKTPQPDAAKKCEFTTPTEYTCTMKDGLKFANGDPVTAQDAAYSFTRVVKINDPNGPASLLVNMKSVTAKDDKTVVFTLNSPNDQTFPQVLVTSAGPIVDKKVFPPDKIIDDDTVVKGQPFSGPYTIGKYQKNQLAQFKANPNYVGAFNKPKAANVTMKYYTSSDNMKLDIQNGNIDVAWRSLTPTDIANLKKAKGVNVYTGEGGELRYMVFNLKTMPGSSAAQKLAIRQAMAYSVDRQALSTQVYKGTYVPAYSIIPSGVPGASTSFKDMYGTSPDKQKAQQMLSAAKVSTPVKVSLQYNSDHYGSNSDQEYNTVKRQLESTGLFKVNLQATEWDTYSKERVTDSYPVYQLGWFPDFPDADNYLTPFLGPNNFIKAHYQDPQVTKLLDKERTDSDKQSRYATMKQIQDIVATQVPILPLLSGAQVAVARDNIHGVQNTLDAAFKFRFTSLSKS